MVWSNRGKIFAGAALFAVLAAASAYAGIALRKRAPAAVTPVEKAQVVPQTPEMRDRARYADVNQIRIALATYQRDVKAYPDSLAAIVPKYLSVPRTDPLTMEAYPYEKTDGSYAISFTLEDNLYALSKGTHTLTPQGFDVSAVVPERAVPEPPAAVTEIPDDSEAPQNPLPAPPPETLGAVDSDKDGLSDDQEPLYGADAAKVDTDGDGLTDFEEAKAFNSDPANPDSDGDGRTDGAEVTAGDDPAGPGKLPTL